MTAVEATLTIVCPDWCTIDAQEHATELWDHGGVCRHRSADTIATDLSNGPGHGYGDDSRPGVPVAVWMWMTTDPEGREVASPAFCADEREYSIEQALALRDAITQAVETYRAAGGVA
jgi:hypothetical protein